jgi:hypothetical protein
VNKEIENIRLKFSCDADWDSMKAIDGIKHCEHCQKKVFDFTDAKQIEFLTVLAENDNNICGRFKKEQITNIKSVFPFWKKTMSAVMVLLGINIFNNKVRAQDLEITNAKQTTPDISKDIITGFVTPGRWEPIYDKMAEFPGGNKAFTNFLSTNLKFKKGMKFGKAIVSFDIDKNGQLSNYKIIKGVSPLNDSEVLRVLKLSPKWKPATFKGKPVIINYDIPVNFSDK